MNNKTHMLPKNLKDRKCKLCDSGQNPTMRYGPNEVTRYIHHVYSCGVSFNKTCTKLNDDETIEKQHSIELKIHLLQGQLHPRPVFAKEPDRNDQEYLINRIKNGNTDVDNLIRFEAFGIKMF